MKIMVSKILIGFESKDLDSLELHKIKYKYKLEKKNDISFLSLNNIYWDEKKPSVSAIIDIFNKIEHCLVIINEGNKFTYFGEPSKYNIKLGKVCKYGE